jgi:hypothetical protein
LAQAPLPPMPTLICGVRHRWRTVVECQSEQRRRSQNAFCTGSSSGRRGLALASCRSTSTRRYPRFTTCAAVGIGWRRVRCTASPRSAKASKSRGCARCFPRLPAGYAAHPAAVQSNGGDGYGEIEADVLAAFIARQQPRRIVQIGCGVSTAVILDAARLAGCRPEVICIDPYPTAFLARGAADGMVELIAQKSQDVPMRRMTDLDRGDFLFVDSTHTVKPGSEVNQIILEVMPRLVPGVIVHFHDI